MKIRVVPHYGFGWYRASSEALNVPSPFVYEAAILAPGKPFKGVLGQVREPGHTLDGLWVRLQQRTMGDEPTYNLYAFAEKPSTFSEPSILTGYASAEVC